jgi:hypothetical protein
LFRENGHVCTQHVRMFPSTSREYVRACVQYCRAQGLVCALRAEPLPGQHVRKVAQHIDPRILEDNLEKEEEVEKC